MRMHSCPFVFIVIPVSPLPILSQKIKERHAGEEYLNMLAGGRLADHRREVNPLQRIIFLWDWMELYS